MFPAVYKFFVQAAKKFLKTRNMPSSMVHQRPTYLLLSRPRVGGYDAAHHVRDAFPYASRSKRPSLSRVATPWVMWHRLHIRASSFSYTLLEMTGERYNLILIFILSYLSYLPFHLYHRYQSPTLHFILPLPFLLLLLLLVYFIYIHPTYIRTLSRFYAPDWE